MTRIQEDFNKVIKYSQELDRVNTDQLFADWEKNKKWFIDAFGGNYIYTYPKLLTFELTPDQKHKKIVTFIDKVQDYWDYYELADFISKNIDGFFENKVIADYLYGDITITTGSKLIRAFKYFVSNEDMLKTIQDEASLIIQENKIEGYLRLSVHPLDFLSLSENTHKWRSCHALDGDFCAGNLSYMTDTSTIIAYLCKEKVEQLPRFGPEVPWNSKYWRMLLHFSEDKLMIFAGRQYPFYHKNIMDMVLSVICSSGLAEKAYGKNIARLLEAVKTTPWLNERITTMGEIISFKDDPLYPCWQNRPPVAASDLITDTNNALEYNDVLYSTQYEPSYAFITETIFGRIIKEPDYQRVPSLEQARFNIGKPVKCLCCNKNPITRGQGIMICSECEREQKERTYCSLCDEIILRHDYPLHISPDGEVYCERCYNNYVQICENCGKWMNDAQSSFRLNDKYYCPICYLNMEGE